MPTTLRPLDARALPAWLERSRTAYTEDLIATGLRAREARRRAQESLDHAFPSGAPGPGHAVLEVVDETGRAVGHLWIGPDTSDDPGAWWIWDITIDGGERGRGFGRAAMLLGEEYARERGAHTLGLNVFGFNTRARGLYESLGYETASIRMRKSLRG